MLIKKNTNKQGESKMYMHENVKVAFKQVTEMLKNKKTCKNGKVFFSLKDANVLSPMAIDILMQLDMETVRSGKFKSREKA
jgi:basic membrane lipoprotein Med (substrate-binding protein (PBP1-ABC) superfamily)